MFDKDKFEFCPYCENQTESDDKITVAMNKTNNTDDTVTMSYKENTEDQVTVRREFAEGKSRLIAGWLVSLDGSGKGRCYSIFEGRNFAGRSREMDIYLSDDMAITRQKHFSLVYEPKKGDFLLVPENGEVILNNLPADKVVVIKENDIITVGNSSFVFVPYCTKERNWNEKDN